MNALIIYAHPQTGGFCEAILEETKSVLAAKNIHTEIIDLYALNYNPVLLEDEHYSRGNKNISQQTASFQEMIKKSDYLVFIYPIWWGTMPAILKGFFDRTMVSGFAYTYSGKMPQGLLKGKKAVVMFTSGGPEIYYNIIKQGRSKKHITKDILAFCGVKAKAYQLGSANHFDDKEKEKVKKFVGKALKI
ncbi:MAG: NAD(P)H-dependent oxidoreductase [archaeon]